MIKSHSRSDLMYVSLKISEDLRCIVVREERGEILDHISAVPVQRQAGVQGFIVK